MLNKEYLIKRQAEAKIPTKYGQFNMISYSVNKSDKMPHIALVAENTNMDSAVNVRIHSECITGDLFGSFRCECGEQLQASMEYVSKHGGVIVYLRQEGRGIGISSKLDAYQLQDQGLNTAEANKALGYDYDGRSYHDAVIILKDLGIDNLCLLTNNPEKVMGLEKGNLNVSCRVPLEITPKSENREYLKTKKEFFGHMLDVV